MPCAAVEGAPQLIGDAAGFRSAVEFFACIGLLSLVCDDCDCRCIRGIDYILSIEQQAFAGIHGQAGGACGLHHLNGLTPITGTSKRIS